jgi:hypothetical protein
MMNSNITAYMARPITELSRDELVESLEQMGWVLLHEKELRMILARKSNDKTVRRVD